MKMDNINVGHAVVYFAGKRNKMEKDFIFQHQRLKQV